MWLILTILCAIATLVTVVYFKSMLPALVFLVLALGFMLKTWRSEDKR